jgi:hypothetical protein
LRVKGVAVLLVIDLILAGGILYLQVFDHGVITLSRVTTTVIVTTTVLSIQDPYAGVNVTSVSCAVQTRSCSIYLSNVGGNAVRPTACLFQGFNGGVGTLSSNGDLPSNGQVVVGCTAPLEMTGIESGARVLGAVFFLKGTPLSWSGVWH